ncbi:hypothetical protein RJ640_007540 [Escallonia rubra]|uniref:Tetratricopeptide repeat protein 5 n=1 Tax=Escallonia rubra TaxID=112253 RepID=A0AA88RI74_9ASTE|nr:hypothetical protein RJ640_007540 [Escallonia rubra]
MNTQTRSSNDEAAADSMAAAAKAADDLYNTIDTFFPQNPDDKISRLHRESQIALRLLDSVPLEQRKLPMQRATHEFLTGKVLDALPDYRKEAEDHLSKAVKLNPSLADAWLCLGNCIWKKGDLHSAKNCFTLALNKGPNKKILCQLSMLERSADNQADIVEESVKHAKEAIALDEKDERMKSSPDLYFNCAAVNKYLENYERALSGFEAAALKDPGLNATVEVQKMVNLLDKIDNMLRGQVKPKRLASLASSLPAIDCKLPDLFHV